MFDIYRQYFHYLPLKRLFMEKQAAGWWRKETIGLVFGFYTLLTMFFVPRLFFTQENQQIYAEIWAVFLFGFGNYLWAILTFAVFFLGERFPLIRPRFFKNLVLHFFFSLIVAAVFASIYVIIVHSIMSGTFTVRNIPVPFIINTITNSFMYYAGSLAVHHAIFYSRKYREREFRLQQAELEMLKMQLHPHFFFNTLNAISALMYRSPKDADRVITQLGDLFRVALRKDKAQEIPLKEELEFLESFLEIHQTLMGKRLTVEWEISPETLDALVPNLILQPLVENAIKHGIAPLEEGGRIEISARRKNGNLVLQVRDSGIGLTTKKIENGNGVGLSNTRARLKNLYDSSQRFEITDAESDGVVVTMEIPFREKVTEQI